MQELKGSQFRDVLDLKGEPSGNSSWTCPSDVYLFSTLEMI
jgi:hypothetical protein